MEFFPAPLEKLVEQFARLPGIGGKSAQRLAFFVLGLSQAEAEDFAGAILDAKRSITCCPVCQNFTSGGLCLICSSAKRDGSTVCVVADPRDVAAIERSRETTFERYLIAMDIPMIGNTASRTLARQFHSSLEEFEEAVYGQFDFKQLPDFGEALHQNIYQWFQEEQNWDIWLGLRELVQIAPPAAPEDAAVKDNPFVGKTVVVTGKVEPYTRGEINAKIEALGAHAGSSVSSKTHYLVCGENAGSKLEKARSLGVTVLTPAQFFEMAGV